MMFRPHIIQVGSLLRKSLNYRLIAAESVVNHAGVSLTRGGNQVNEQQYKSRKWRNKKTPQSTHLSHVSVSFVLSRITAFL